jgi:hypothetical protein
VLVHLSDDALAAAEGPSALLKHQNRGRSALSQRPIPEVVVPFLVPQEPLVSVAPYALLALLAATAVGVLLLIVL